MIDANRRLPAITSGAPPPPPKHLRRQGAAYWRRVVASYPDDFRDDSEDQDLLRLCCEQLDRCWAANRKIRGDGLFIKDRFGHTKPHAAAEIERQAALAFVRIRRELNLDEAPSDTRPPLPAGYR